MHFILYVLTLLSFQFSAQAAAEKDFSSVLLIGDSHAYGRYGTVLDSYFRERSEKVSSFASCGSSPSTWTKGSSKFAETNCGFWSKKSADKETRVKSHRLPSFQEELKSTQPEVVVISMGTNILSSPQNIDRELKITEDMLKSIQAQKSQCVWVGPPDLLKNPFKANLELGIKKLKELTAKYNCSFVDSRKVTKYPSGKNDGIHYGQQDSARWGQYVVEELKTIVKKPATTTAKPSSPSGTKATGTR